MNKKTSFLPYIFVFFVTFIIFVIAIYTTSLFYNSHIYADKKFFLSQEITDVFKRIFLSFEAQSSHDQDDIETHFIYLSSSKIDILNALGSSNDDYKSGFLRIDNILYDAKFRYRGDNPWHFVYPKKSWRVKIDKEDMTSMIRKYNLINPKTNAVIENKVAMDLAQKLGLLAPESKFIRLYVNNQYVGVYEYLEQPDESFIRKNKRLPSDLYSGDISQLDVLWSNSDYWEKQSELDSQNPEDKKNIETLLSAVQNYTQSLENLESVIDIDAFLTWYVHGQFFGQVRFDNHHNHKYYFDPSSGRFEPIAWDTIGQGTSYPLLSIHKVPNPIFAQLFRDPTYVHKKNEKLYNLSEKQLSTVIEDIDTTARAIRSAVGGDMLKDYVDVLTAQVHPYTQKDFDKAIVQFKEFLQFRQEFIKNQLNETKVEFITQKISPGIWKVKCVVNGNSGVYIRFRDEEIFSVYKDIDGDGIGDSVSEKTELLFPGLKKVDVQKRNTPYLSFDYEPAPLVYDFIVQSPKDSFDHASVEVINAVINQVITPVFTTLEKSEKDFSDTSIISIHPWEKEYISSSNKTIKTLQGTKTLHQNLVIDENTELHIEPGTTLFFMPNVSLISFGKVIAKGTEDQPILFTSATQEPWGAIAIQGEKSNGSVFHYVTIENGSGTSYGLVKYTGMLSVYNSSIELKNTILQNNTVFDDTFNAKHSIVTIDHCKFLNTFSDAIDFDYSQGKIVYSYFSNAGNDAIDLMTSNPEVAYNTIINAGDKGVSVGENSTPSIHDNHIQKSNIAIEIKDASDPSIFDNIFEQNGIGINAYHKNWRYPKGGQGEVTSNIFIKNKKNEKQDKDSSVLFKDNIYE